MGEIEFYLELCTKDELIDIINKMDVSVKGFSKNFTNAPEFLLRNSLEQALSKRGGKRFNSLINNKVKYLDFFDDIDINSFIVKAYKFKSSISQSDFLLKFLNLFPDKKDKHLPKLQSI